MMKYFLCCLFSLICSFSFASEGRSQADYKLYCMYTPHFEELFEQYFLPNIKDDFEVIAAEYPQDCSTGTFRADGWEKTMLYKLELLKKAILENWNDQVFFYSDVDIVFFKPVLEICLGHLGDNDFVVQQGWPRNGICAGFFVMRGNEKTLNLIEKAYVLLQEKICIDDQVAIQTVLDRLKSEDISWAFLPSKQFANGRRVLKHACGHFSEDSEVEFDHSIAMFHANCCVGLENKYLFLQKMLKQYSRSNF